MQLTINLDETTKQLNLVTDSPIQIDDLMTILFTIQLQALNQIKEQVKQTTPDKAQEIIESLYDNYNAGASNVLYLFAPDEELHPDLTVEAMKEAEDRYMYNHLNRETRRQIDKKTKGETKILRFPNQNQEKQGDQNEEL